MRDVVRGVVIGALLLALLGAIASRGGWLDVAVPRPAGMGAWFAARATGFTAFGALALDVILGLAMSTRAGDRWVPRAHALDLHGWLSPVALALVCGHAFALLADRYIRFDVVDVLVPFAAPYRPVAVGIGVLAGYVAIVVHASFAFRKRIGTKTWRRLHYLSFVAFAGAAVHGIAAGSDTTRPWAIAVYAVPLAAVVALVGLRVRTGRASASSDPKAVAPAARCTPPAASR